MKKKKTVTVLGGGTVLCRVVREGCSDAITFEQRAEGREQRAMCISAERGFQVKGTSKAKAPR